MMWDVVAPEKYVFKGFYHYIFPPVWSVKSKALSSSASGSASPTNARKPSVCSIYFFGREWELAFDQFDWDSYRVTEKYRYFCVHMATLTVGKAVEWYHHTHTNSCQSFTTHQLISSHDDSWNHFCWRNRSFIAQHDPLTKGHRSSNASLSDKGRLRRWSWTCCFQC